MRDYKKHAILILLVFAFVLAVCGTASATVTTNQSITKISNSKNIQNNIVTNVTNTISSSTTVSKTQTTSSNSNTGTKKPSKKSIAGDPIISGTVTISEYSHVRNLANATITVYSTSSPSRALGITTTDENGNYIINFYSTETQFDVTASYLGCASVTNRVTVTQGPDYPTDPNYYGTSNFQLTPYTATLTGTGNGVNVYIQGKGANGFAGVINVQVNGSSYQSYCIDLFTDISIRDTLLVNGPLPGTAGDLPTQVDWGKVNYILTHYTPSSNNEAAAIQCAIWYYTSVMYGPYPGGLDPNHPTYYQFMTAPNDGRINGATGSTAVRNRAWEIINAAQSMVYPESITVSPDFTRIPNGGTATITATVNDNNGNPLPGITVNFTTTGGSLSPNSGTTDSNGQVTTTLSGVSNNRSVTVTAAVSGNYGNLLYDNQYATVRKQNLVARNLLPSIVSAISIVNTDATANVVLSQTANSPVNVGDTVTYTVTATNNGPDTATGILISDVAPAGLSGVTYTLSPTPTGTSYYNGMWTIPSLANGASATLTITGTATAAMAGTTTTNTATRTAQNEYNPSPAVSTADVYTKLANVTITNTPNLSNINVGETGVFTLTVTNNGPDLANIQITDLLSQLPAGFTAGTPSTGNYNPITGIWTITNLATGSENAATITFSAVIQAAQAGTNIINHATETQTEYPFTTTITDATMHVNLAHVALTQSARTPVNVGDTVTFLITATNQGPDTVTNVNISDVLPTGFTAYPDPGTYFNSGIWTIPSLANGVSVNLTITGIADASMAGKNTINTATVTSQTEFDPLPKETTTASVYTKIADLRVTNYVANAIYTWSYYNTPTLVMDVANYGPDDATGVVAEYILPVGVKFIEADTRGVGTYTYNPATRTVTWTIGNMPNGGAATIDVFALIEKTGTLITTGRVQHSDQYDPTPNPTKDLTITVPTSADIQITQTSSNYNPTLNENITLTVNVANNGPDNAAGIVITDTIPTGLDIDLEHTTSHGIGTITYDTGTRLLTWTIGNMTNTATATLDIVVTVTSTDMIKNRAIRSKPPQYDWNYNNNSQIVYLNQGSYTPQTDLKVTNYNANGITTWSYINTPVFVMDVANYGPDDADNVIAEYILPNGMTFLAADTRGTGTYNYNPATQTITWTIGNMPNGGAATIDVFVLLNNTTGNQTSTAKIKDTTITKDLTINVPTSADIQITQTSSNYNPTIGENITLTVNVTNNGPDNAAGIIITDTIPTGLDIDLEHTTSHGIGTITYNPDTRLLTWTIGNMNNTATATLDIATTVNTTGTIKNRPTRSKPPQYDWNYNNNSQITYLAASDQNTFLTV